MGLRGMSGSGIHVGRPNSVWELDRDLGVMRDRPSLRHDEREISKSWPTSLLPTDSESPKTRALGQYKHARREIIVVERRDLPSASWLIPKTKVRPV